MKIYHYDYHGHSLCYEWWCRHQSLSQIVASFKSSVGTTDTQAIKSKRSPRQAPSRADVALINVKHNRKPVFVSKSSKKKLTL